MMLWNRRAVILLAATLALAGCKQDEAQDVSAQEMTTETLGHYCQMNLLEHAGPKAQVHLEGMPGKPLFFSQVRDAIAYIRAPEQMAPILAVYVNDMGRDGATWDDPGEGNWLAAEDAFFVVETGREGGMGAPETIPFGTLAQAEAFASDEGGRVLRLDEITDDMVLAPVDIMPLDGDDDTDFEQRLRALGRPIGS